MKMPILRTALLGAALALMGISTGCGKKETPLDTAAPPPSQPNAQREVAPNKPRPNAPPTMGAPPQTK
jgi:hypothetical protein